MRHTRIQWALQLKCARAQTREPSSERAAQWWKAELLRVLFHSLTQKAEISPSTRRVWPKQLLGLPLLLSLVMNSLIMDVNLVDSTLLPLSGSIGLTGADPGKQLSTPHVFTVNSSPVEPMLYSVG